MRGCHAALAALLAVALASSSVSPAEGGLLKQDGSQGNDGVRGIEPQGVWTVDGEHSFLVSGTSGKYKGIWDGEKGAHIWAPSASAAGLGRGKSSSARGSLRAADKAEKVSIVRRAVERAFAAGEEEGMEKQRLKEIGDKKQKEELFLSRESPAAVHDCGIYGNDCNSVGGGPDGDKGTYMRARTIELAMGTAAAPHTVLLSGARRRVVGHSPRHMAAKHSAESVKTSSWLLGMGSQSRAAAQLDHDHSTNTPWGASGGSAQALAKQLYKEAVEAAQRSPEKQAQARQAGNARRAGIRGRLYRDVRQGSGITLSAARPTVFKGRLASDRHDKSEGAMRTKIHEPVLRIVFPPEMFPSAEGTPPPVTPPPASPSPSPTTAKESYKYDPVADGNHSPLYGEARQFGGGQGEEVQEQGEEVHEDTGENAVSETQDEESQATEVIKSDESEDEGKSAKDEYYMWDNLLLFPGDESDTPTSVLHIIVVLVVFTILMFCCVGCVSRARKSKEEQGEDGDFWRLYGKEIGRAVAFGREDVNDAVRQVKTRLDDWRASAASQGTGDAESNQDASSGSQEANTDEQPNKASGWAGKLKSGLAGMFSSVKSDAPPTEQTPLTADQSPASEKRVPKAATYV